MLTIELPGNVQAYYTSLLSLIPDGCLKNHSSKRAGIYSIISSMKEVKKALTKGLIAGYAGKLGRKTKLRNCFNVNYSRYVDAASNTVYHDEWIANRVGGGQELVEVGDSALTRVYAGGTISIEGLESLGLSKKDVTNYLKKKILDLKEKTRLLEDCKPKPDGNWQYSYQIIDNETNIPLTIGKETITYKRELVFVHGMMLCPIE